MALIESRSLAEYIVHFFNQRGEPLTNKKLQKLLYYTQAWHIVYFEKDQLIDELPEAWVHGPVYPRVYKKYKKYKAKTISENPMNRELLNEKLESFNLSEEQKSFLNAVLSTYGSKSALKLELLTHSEEPWLYARKDLKDFDLSSEVINPDIMYTYYNSKIQ